MTQDNKSRKKVKRHKGKKEVDMVSDLLDVKEAAAYLKIQVSTLRCWCFNRTIPFYKIGGLVRFRKADLDAFIKRGRISSQKKTRARVQPKEGEGLHA